MESASLKMFEKIVNQMEDASLGKLFGKPSGNNQYKKAFVCFYEDEMVFKVGKETVQDLLQVYTGSQNFDPSKKGRPMKDWIQIPNEYKKDWKKLAKQAEQFCDPNI